MKKLKLMIIPLIALLAAGCGNNAADTVTSADAEVQTSAEAAADEQISDTEIQTSAEAAADEQTSDPLWENAIYTGDTDLGEGSAAVAVEISAGKKSVTVTLHTDEEYLGNALTANGLVEGEESEFGLYIKSVNGIRADYDLDGAYWSISKDGEATLSGADTTPIADGEHYELTYTAA